MATTTRWAQESLSRSQAESLWQVIGEAHARGESSVGFVPYSEVVGGAALTTIRRKAHCRACGEAMPKGADAIQFAYRWVPTFHYRITESFIHAGRCR